MRIALYVSFVVVLVTLVVLGILFFPPCEEDLLTPESIPGETTAPAPSPALTPKKAHPHTPNLEGVETLTPKKAHQHTPNREGVETLPPPPNRVRLSGFLGSC
jgi:hypothetical protein